MSWQAYVDSSLVGTGHIDKAAIFNKEGNSVWAASAGYTISPQEMQEIVAAYNDPSPVTEKKVMQNGFHVAGEKYITLKADERSLYGKQGKTGVVIVKTMLSIIVAHYPESVQPGTAATVVEMLGDYLIGVKY